MSAGDFHQLPPVGAKLLCNALVQDCISVPSKLTGKPLKNLKFGNQSPGKKGIRLFRKFERYKLTVNQRSKNDDRWAGILLRMRNTKSAQPVPAAFIDPVHGVQPLSTAEAKTDEWADAQISCLGHAEGDVVSAARAYQFATRHGRVLVRWRLPLCGREAEWLSPQEIEALYRSEPGMWGYYVLGAPAILQNNICVQKGLANGSSCVMHSLSLQDRATADRELLARAGPGNVVTLQLPPYSINVTPTALSEHHTALLLQEGHSLVEDGIVIPIGRMTKNEPHSCTSIYAAQEGIRTLHVEQHNVTLAFVLTDYKVCPPTPAPYAISSPPPRPPAKPVECGSPELWYFFHSPCCLGSDLISGAREDAGSTHNERWVALLQAEPHNHRIVRLGVACP
jgi:hypothetical protein